VDRIELFGYPVDIVTPQDAVRWASRNKPVQSPKTIVVVNANKLWLAEGEPWLKEFICQADLILPEYAIVWAARQLGLPEIHAVYGVSFTQDYLALAEVEGMRPFFLGGTRAVVQQLSAELRRKYPKLRTAGMHHGYFSTPESNLSIIEKIRLSQPDILFVGMGSPRQEKWIQENIEYIETPVVVGVGGTLDVISGEKGDTPRWLRGSGFEWLYRLILNPLGYWKRYLITNPWYVYKVFREKLRN